VPTTTIDGSASACTGAGAASDAAAGAEAADAADGASACAQAPTVILASAPPKQSRNVARGLNGCACHVLRVMLFIVVSELLFYGLEPLL
jgi:3-hydroxyisobutyrate dehydrogenase-like beta-hydroxyacid dehydrogenase